MSEPVIPVQNQVVSTPVPGGVTVHPHGAEGAPVSVTTPVESVDLANVDVDKVIEDGAGAEFANAPTIDPAVSQAGVVTHAAPVHPDLKQEIIETENIYKPVWQSVQEAQDAEKTGDPTTGKFAKAVLYIKNMLKRERLGEEGVH